MKRICREYGLRILVWTLVLLGFLYAFAALIDECYPSPTGTEVVPESQPAEPETKPVQDQHVTSSAHGRGNEVVAPTANGDVSGRPDLYLSHPAGEARLVAVSRAPAGSLSSQPAGEPAVGRRCTTDSTPAGVVYRVTAYCSCKLCCGPRACGITASGKPVSANGGRFVAADRSIPFGTMLTIPGYGTVPVLDRGGAIRGNRIDLYFPTHQTARRVGVKYLNVKEIH
ncbi:MAG: 3D domain-containing protein [Candidatus Atribacteria bacterium]|nr:3D domain-containing protein [Candidatus Atribacteria bacterium]